MVVRLPGGGPSGRLSKALTASVGIVAFVAVWSFLVGDFAETRARILVSIGDVASSSPPLNLTPVTERPTINKPLVSKIDPYGQFAGVDSAFREQIVQTSSQFWRSAQHVFAFGDSYTSTWFDADGTLPTHENPYGNRAKLPFDRYYDGPKYIESLGMKYNASVVEVYNFAVGGATVHPDVVEGGARTTCLNEQMDGVFLPTFSRSDMARAPPWTPEQTLFVLFFGINDINISWIQRRRAPISDILKMYSFYIEELVTAGGREFLLLNVPPLDLLHPSLPGTAGMGEDIARYNLHLRRMRDELVSRHSITIRLLDIHTLWLEVMHDPQSHTLTAGLKDTTTWCETYLDGVPSLDYKAEECEYPVDEYMWLNGLHPTHVVHTLTAAVVQRDCLGETVAGYCS